MALQNLTFATDVDAWVRKSQARLDAVHRMSVEELAKEVRTPKAKGGNMPVDTGFLRNSMVASTEAPAPINPKAHPDEGATYDKTGDRLSGPVNLVILGWEMGKTIWITFTAAYAARQEYGFVGEDSLGRSYAQNGSAFVRIAAQNWREIVSRVVQRVKSGQPKE